MLILKSDISVVCREDFETDCELLWTQIIKDSSSIMLSVFYQPPGSGSSPLSDSIILCCQYLIHNTSSYAVISTYQADRWICYPIYSLTDH